MSGPDHSELESFDIDRELQEAGRQGPRLAQRIGGVNVIDPTKIGSLVNLSATRMIVLLPLLLAVKDRATELRFEPWRDEGEDGGAGHDQASVLRMSYVIDGQLHELVPPPAMLLPFISREIQAIAGLDSPRSRFANLLRRLASRIDGQILPPRRGEFRLQLDPFETHIEVVIYPSDWGDRLFLQLPRMPDALAERVQAEMKRLIELRRTAKGGP